MSIKTTADIVADYVAENDAFRAQLTQLQEQLATANERARVAEEQRAKAEYQRDSYYRAAEDAARERDAALSRVRSLEEQAARVRAEEIEECAREADQWATNPPVAPRSSEYVARCIAKGIREKS